MIFWPRFQPAASLFLLVLAFVIGAWLPSPSGAELIINEVLSNPGQDWDGDGTLDFKGDEWVEVLNNGYEVEDLSEYYLRDVWGEDPHLQLDGLLRAGEVKVYYGSDAMAWQVANGYSDYGFALNNTGDTVELLRRVVDQEPVIFELAYSVTLLNHEADEDRSSGWAQEGGGWILFDALNVYGGSQVPGTSGCQPTPGDLNFCIPLVPIHESSLGGVKSFYR